MHDPMHLDATELTHRYRTGASRPPDILDRLIGRIEAYDTGLNAIWELDRDNARRAALESDKRWKAGTARPLEGVPFVAKDLIDTRRVRTSYGSAMFAAHVPEHDAAIVQRLKDLGAILLGKTATDEYAWGITTVNPHFGATRNPWNPALVAGGSSGGSAVALAAGFAPLALGTDTAGSIRIPASFCGVAGLKPTYGTVDSRGIFVMCPSLDHAGPMARSVRDLQLIWPMLGPVQVARGISCVGVLRQFGTIVPEGSITDTIDCAALALQDLGIEVIDLEFEIPDLYPTLATIVLLEASTGHRLKGRWPAHRGAFGPDLRRRLELAETVTSDQYQAALMRRVEIRNAALAHLDRVDALLTPVSSVQPIAIDDAARRGAEFRAQVIEFTALASLTGFPALALRGGFDAAGVPIGIQLIGGPGDDASLLTLGMRLEEALALGNEWPQDGLVERP